MSDVPLKEHLESRLRSLELAREKAEQMLEKRLDSMNEFRDALKDQASRMLTREEAELRFRVLENAKSESEGKAKLTAILWAALTSLTIGAVLFLLRKP